MLPLTRLNTELLIILGGMVVLALSGHGSYKNKHFRGSGASLKNKNANNNVNSGDMHCPSCDQISCPTPRRVSKLRKQCRGGITTSVCDCCVVCARVVKEHCGGEYNYLGKCDKGLYCHPNAKQPNTNQIPEGKCRKDPKMIGDTGHCENKCTPKYCRAHPKAICAAYDIADEKSTCQGSCQHTACNACRYVSDTSPCLKCGKDDYSCMRKFAKCIKKQVCVRKFPCNSRKNGRKSKIAEQGKFTCKVPKCLDS